MFCYCWVKLSIDVEYIQLVDGIVEFRMCLLVFCLLDLSISDRGVLESPPVTVESSISPCRSISFCHIYFDTLLLGPYK